MSADQDMTIRSEHDHGNRVLNFLRTLIKRLIVRKPFNQIQGEIETQNDLRRVLNWYQLTALGLGIMIGK